MEATKGEQEPLLKPEPQDFSKLDVGVPVSDAAHEWDGHLCAWFGRCDSPGLLSCLVVHFVPCMAWGYNVKRAFKHSMLLHATLYFLLLMGSGYLLMGANHAEDRLCPHGPADEASAYARMAGAEVDAHSNRKLLLVHRRLAEAGAEVSGADQSAAAAAMFEAADEDEGDEAALIEILDADDLEELAEIEDEDEDQDEPGERSHEQEMLMHREEDDEDEADGAEDDEDEEREQHKGKHGHHKKHRHGEDEDDDDDDDEDEEHERHHKHHPKEHRGKEEKGRGCHKHKPHPPPPEPVPWGELPQECRRAIVAKHASVGWALLCSLLGIAYCAARRTQLREKFGIAGSRMGDLCTWLWCSPCALCQETRTLWANNVAEGVWHGPAQQQLLPATSPPPAQAVAGALVAPKTV